MNGDNIIRILNEAGKQKDEDVVRVVPGEVVKTDPLEVKISSKITLDEDFIEMLNGSKRKLKKGQKLNLVKMAGGQLFVGVLNKNEDFDELEERVEKLEGRADKLEDRCKALEDRCKDIEGDVSALQTLTSTQGTTISGHTTELANHETRITTLEGKV
jgi:chromosome segregation ATPase